MAPQDFQRPAWVREQRIFNVALGAAPVPLLLAQFDGDRMAVATMGAEDRKAHAFVEGCVPRRQAEFVAGRWAARHMLRNAGSDAESIPVGNHREPIWPSGLIGSISHSGSWVAATVLPARPYTGVGIDLESVVAEDVARTLRTQVVDAAEQHILSDADIDEHEAITIAFSAKESFFKATFAAVGRYFDFDAVRVTRIDCRSDVLHLVAHMDLAPVLPAGKAFEARFMRVEPATVLTVLAW